MNAKPISSEALNWDDLRLFLPVARIGSLTEAARVLDVSISTVARRLTQLEQSLGLSLFLRSQSGYALTADGQRLLEKAAAVEGAMMGVNRLADAEAVAGRVRLALPEGLALHILLPRLEAFRTAHPAITLDIVTGPFSLDLTRRESDLALRLIKPVDNDLVTRRLGIMAHGVYAAPDSRTLSKLNWLPEMRRLPIAAATAAWIEQNDGKAGAEMEETAFNNLTTLAAAAAAGLGQALLPCIVGDADPRLRRLAGPEGFFVQEVWLVFHRDLRRSPRLRPVADFLAACLAEAADRLAGTAFKKFSSSQPA
ncbi:MAG: LysR family transcriptional regulator [Dongiaceae bacterium]